MTNSAPKTLYDKLWASHLVHEAPGEASVIYIDRHLVHEVTSAQAFGGLREAKRKVRRPDLTLATVDHNVPTTDRSHGIAEEESRIQVATLARNAAEFGIKYFNELDKRQGIVHVVGPEQGFTLPGTLVAAGNLDIAATRSTSFRDMTVDTHGFDVVFNQPIAGLGMTKLGAVPDYRPAAEFDDFLNKDAERIKATLRRIGKVD